MVPLGFSEQVKKFHIDNVKHVGLEQHASQYCVVCSGVYGKNVQVRGADLEIISMKILLEFGVNGTLYSKCLCL